MKKTLDVFLEETKYCDIGNLKIRNKVKSIVNNYDNDTEKAVALFYWVRDNIKYKFGSWSLQASDILDNGVGMCTNKAVLLTTFLRAAGIPAGFGILRVKGQDYFGPIAPKFLKDKVSKTSVHFYSYVNLNNRWIKIDSSVDNELSIKTNYFNPTTKLTEWSGDHDATENLDPSTILEDLGPFYNVDDKLQKKPRRAKYILLKIGNYYLDFLRQNSIKIVNPRVELEPLFKKWMWRKHFVYYIIYVIYFNIVNNYEKNIK